ncbi:MAG: T9SS type A sorting domain-containing protein [Bacteroidota bacterium]
MKNTIKLLGIFMLITAWTVLFINLPMPKATIMGPIGEDEMSAGDKDNPNAAFMYEFNRIKDPMTGTIPMNMHELETEYAATLPQDIDGMNNMRMAIAPLDWVSRGPYNIGGRTRALAVDINNDSILLAGSVSGNMWRSVNQGASWTQVTAPSSLHNISCVTQDTRTGHTNNWFYGTGEAYGASAFATGAFPMGNGMFRSNDNGVTWTSLTSTASNVPQSFVSNMQLIWNMKVDQSVDTTEVVYAASYNAIYRSLDSGTTWNAVLYQNASQQAYFTDIAIANNGAKYATMSSDGPTAVKGIWRSMNGTTWTKITPPTFPNVYNRTVIGIDPNNENNVYFLSVTPGAGKPSVMYINYQPDSEYYSLWKYTYLSGNGDSAGGNWVDLSQNIPYNASMAGNYFAQGGYDMYVRVQPGDSNVVFLGGTDIFRSTDAYTSNNNWSQIGGYSVNCVFPNMTLYPNHHPDQHNLVFFHNNPHAMISSCDGGVFKTMSNMDSAITWVSCNNGYTTTQFYACSVDHATPNNEIIVGGLQDNGSFFTNTANVTAPWTWSSKGDGGYSYVLDNHNYYYFSIQQGKVYRSQLDANGNPIAFRRVDPIGGGGYNFIQPFAVDPNDNNVLYFPDSTHIWRNSDLSAIALTNQYDSISTNWTKIDSLTGLGQITAIAASKFPANRLYVGTSNHAIVRIDSANTSHPVHTVVTSNQFNAGANVSCIAIDPTNADRAMVVFSNYLVKSVFFTSDAGAHWTNVSGNLEQFLSGSGNGPSCRWASIMPVNGDTVYWMGTSTGLYATSHLDSVHTVWVHQGTATIGNAIVDMIDTRLSDGLVIVATHGNGMFSTNITDITQLGEGIQAIHSLASPMQLRNYPNPANDHTTISFNLPQRGNIEMKIYDIKGKEMAMLYKGIKDAGLNTIRFNTGTLANGIYFCHLTSGDLSETKKIVVAKE